MMRKLYILFVSCIIAGIFSCNKTDISKGPDLVIGNENISLTEEFSLEDTLIDFVTNTAVIFSAELSEEVDYRIEIEGRSSGATYTLRGTGKSVRKEWFGQAQSVFFKTEVCTATLYTLGKSSAISAITFEIVTLPIPSEQIIADMEPLGRNLLEGFWEGPVNGNPTKLACERINLRAIQGDFAYKLEGINYGNNANRFLGLAFSKPINGVNGINNNGIKYRLPTDNAEELWFSVWIYGNGKDDSFLAVKFLQDDNLSGDHDGASDNGFEYFIRDVSHFGWKEFTVRYDQLVTSGNVEFGGAGDGVHRPETITQIEFALWAKTTNKPVKIIMDYPVFFTKNMTAVE